VGCSPAPTVPDVKPGEELTVEGSANQIPEEFIDVTQYWSKASETLQEEYLERQKLDALEDIAEDAGEAVVDSFNHIPFIRETLGEAFEDAGDFAEDVVDHQDDPVVDPWL